MKPKSIKSILAVALLAPGALFAATATTTPVGYVSMDISGDGSLANPKLSYIGASLVRTTSFSGAANLTGVDDVVNFDGTPLSALTTGLNSLSEPTHYAQVVTGPNAGQWTDIISNTSSSITTTDDVASIFNGQTIVIRQHHTLASLFGASSEDVLLLQGGDISSADEIKLFDAISQAASSFYFSTADANEDEIADGWVFADGTPAASKVIAPTDGMIVARKAAGELSLSQDGEVNITPFQIRVEAQDNIVPINRAVGESFRLSPLTATLAAGGRTGSNLVGSGLLGGESISEADELTLLVDGNPITYYFSTADANEDEIQDGWVLADGTPSGDLILKEGSAVKIKRKSTVFLWEIPTEPVDQSPIIGISN